VEEEEVVRLRLLLAVVLKLGVSADS